MENCSIFKIFKKNSLNISKITSSKVRVRVKTRYKTTHQKIHVTHFSSALMHTTVSIHASCQFRFFSKPKSIIFLFGCDTCLNLFLFLPYQGIFILTSVFVMSSQAYFVVHFCSLVILLTSSDLCS